MPTRPTAFPRYIDVRLREALADSPAVLIHGPRQSGKSTLARTIGDARGYRYYSFDDDALVQVAKRDPIGFVADLGPRAVLDEVQRVPEIFTSLKAAIDHKRTPGRFILTGSANVLMVPKLADSLAGRMAILRLHPLSQGELAGQRPRFLGSLFRGRFRTRLTESLGDNLADRIVAGGFPAALVRRTIRRRDAWYRDYIETQIQRDVRDLSRIRSLETLPRLLALAASQTARIINIADLAAPFELSRPTINEHVTLLERVFLLDRLPAWHTNRLSRLVKRPKLHLADTGVAAALLETDANTLRADRPLLGQLLETFTLQELRRQAGFDATPTAFFHYRDRDDFEVDVVLSQGRSLAGVEIKAAKSVNDSDFRGLRKLRLVAGSSFVAGVVLYDGTAVIPFDKDLFAIPIRLLWEN